MKKQLVAVIAMVMSMSMVFGACTGTPTTGDGTPTESGASSVSSEGTPIGDSSTDPVDVTGVETTTDKGQTLFVGTEAHGGNYNYMYSASSYDRQVCELVYSSLVTSRGDGITKPTNIVEKMEISEDGLDYTFTLVDGIKFSDGSDLKASDIVFTYKALSDPSSTAYFLSSKDALKGANEYFKKETTEWTAVEAIDDKTVVFHFTENLRTNIGSCGIGIISEAYYPDWEYGKSEEVLNAKMAQPLGSGPYTVNEYAPSQFVSLKYNDSFWADAITDYKIKDVVVKFTNGDTEMDEIITGSVDVLPQIIDKAYVDRVLNNEDNRNATEYINLTQYKRSAYGYLGFNTRTGSAANVAVRQAVALAFDRAAFVEAQYGDLARPLAVPMSQASSIFDAVQGDLNQYTHSFEEAKATLEAAGYTYDGDTCLDPEGNKVVLKFLATTGNPVINAMAPVLSDNLTQIGIELDIQSIDFASMLEIVQSENDDWNMIFMANGWSSDEPDTWFANFHSSYMPQTNTVRYNNPKVDELLEKGRTYLDLTAPEAIDNYSQIAVELNRDLPQLPIYANTLTAMINTRVKNMNIDTFRDWHIALEGAYIEEN